MSDSQELDTLRQQVADLTSEVNRLKAALIDYSYAIEDYNRGTSELFDLASDNFKIILRAFNLVDMRLGLLEEE